MPHAEEKGRMKQLEKMENANDEECRPKEQEEVCNNERCIFSRPILAARKAFDAGLVVWACEMCRERKCVCGARAHKTEGTCECLSRGGFGVNGFIEAEKCSFANVKAQKDAIRMAHEETISDVYQPEPLGYEVRFANYCRTVNANYRAISKGKKDKAKKPDGCFRCKEGGLDLARCNVPGCYRRYHVECADTSPCPRHSCSICGSDDRIYTCALCPIALCDYHVKGRAGGVVEEETWHFGTEKNSCMPDPVVLYVRNRVMLCTDCIILIKNCKETHALLYSPDVSMFKKIWG